MKNATLLLLAALTISGCTSVRGIVSDIFQRDMQRLEELSEKYSSPGVAKCAKYLNVATAGIKEVRDEPVSGIFSEVYKLALLRRMAADVEERFAEECGEVAARLLIELGRKASIGR